MMPRSHKGSPANACAQGRAEQNIGAGRHYRRVGMLRGASERPIYWFSLVFPNLGASNSNAAAFASLLAPDRPTKV
jgi:hypothetical protein